MPDGSAEALAGWTNAAGTMATQAMGLFSTSANAQGATSSESLESESKEETTATSTSSFSRITTAAEALASQATGVFLHRKSEDKKAEED